MKNMIKLSFIGLFFLLLTFSGATAEEEFIPTRNYSLWIGSHYTSLNDYTKKVGEYNLGIDDDVLPELEGYYRFRDATRLLDLSGHYYDNKNIKADIKTILGNRFSADLYYRSLVHQSGQDLLANLETREAGGGKILTHELTDPFADYKIHRHEFGGKVNLLLSKEHNIRMMASHRSIMKKGDEQKISTNHCFSCHVTSESAQVKRSSHQIETGIQGDVGKFTLGYQFGYRTFSSSADYPTAYYDTAMHPVWGADSVNTMREFQSRLAYQDTTIAFGVYPETKKMSHKIRAKGEVGKGQVAGALTYSQTRNSEIINPIVSELKADAWTGYLNYSVVLNPKTRLIARVTGKRLTNDDPYVDVPTFREGRGGMPSSVYINNFDFIRYSSLDRAEGMGTVEMIRRMSPKITVNLLAGFQLIDRYDYPTLNNHYKTKRFIGQGKFKYRNGLKFTGSMKYRFEKTSDPFISFRGIFEAEGYDDLIPAITTPTSYFIFYYQREDLRYQNITTEPTDYHEFELSSTFKPSMKTGITAGIKGLYDKNGDLDSLDVKHLSLRPNLSLNVMPNPKFSFVTGYTYGYYKSQGPVAVALFDG